MTLKTLADVRDLIRRLHHRPWRPNCRHLSLFRQATLSWNCRLFRRRGAADRGEYSRSCRSCCGCDKPQFRTTATREI